MCHTCRKVHEFHFIKLYKYCWVQLHQQLKPRILTCLLFVVTFLALYSHSSTVSTRNNFFFAIPISRATRTSQSFCPWTQNPPNYSINSRNPIQLLKDAGFVRKSPFGLITWLPIGFRVLQKLQNHIQNYLRSLGSQDLLLPCLESCHSKKIWNDPFVHERFVVNDKDHALFYLTATNEMPMAQIFKNELRSYADLPQIFHQFGNKYRKEKRLQGLKRCSEFIMMDAYSFHTHMACLDHTYSLFMQAIISLLDMLKLPVRIVEVTPGRLEGMRSHEFKVQMLEKELLEIHNDEKISSKFNEEKTTELMSSLWQKKYMFKTIFIHALKNHSSYNQFEYATHAIVLRRNDSFDVKKLKDAIKVYDLMPVSPNPSCWARFDSLSPTITSDAQLDETNIVIDKRVWNELQSNTDLQRECVHLPCFTKNFSVADVSISGNCQSQADILTNSSWLEVAHTFQLGDVYSSAVKATFMDKIGKKSNLLMGSYGIGITRLVEALAQRNIDKRGFNFPTAIAPYDIAIIPLQSHRCSASREVAEILLKFLLKETKYDVILEDKSKNDGESLAMMNLIGVPYHVIISPSMLFKNNEKNAYRSVNDILNICVELRTRTKEICDVVQIRSLPQKLREKMLLN